MALPPQIDLDRRAIPEQIAEGLTRLVLSGELPSGQPVHEATIAADLGVSRNTVREAVRLLERSGLVRYESNRGAVVREPSPSSLADVYRARSAIELGALLITAADAVDCSRLDAPLSRLAATLAAGDWEAAITADVDFHRAMVALADSPRLNDALVALLNELRLYLKTMTAASGQVPFRPTISDHREMADALLDPDRGRLSTLLGRHLSAEAESVLAALQTASGEARSAVSSRL